jgi:hypothetical protein
MPEQVSNAQVTIPPIAGRKPGSWRPGLRVKFNAALVPLVAGILILLVLLDYHHEFRSVMDAHAMHSGPIGAAAIVRPVQEENTPKAVAVRALAIHAVAGGFTLIALIAAVNITLSRLVLVPIGRVRAGMERLQPRFTAGNRTAARDDEVGEVAAAFSTLGVSIDAVVLRSLETERLATLALLAKTIGAEIEPEVRRLATAAARLQDRPDAAAHAAAHEIAGAAARIYAAVRRLDTPFLASARDRVKVRRRQSAELNRNREPAN